MLTLESWARWSIYSLGGEGIHGPRPFTVRRQGRPDVLVGRAGCPGFQATPDVRAGEAGCPGWSGGICCSRVRRAQISGLAAGCPGARERPDVRAVAAGCPEPVASGGCAAVVDDAPGAGCPGSWPDVRGLGDVLGSFRWFSSSVDLGTCTSSCASSRGPSWCLIMHNTSDLGSSHVSCIESGSSERREFTLSSIALARAHFIGPSGVVGGVGASMGMILG